MGKVLRVGEEVIAFPGVDGAPFRGTQIPNMMHRDAVQPQVVLSAKVKVLDLAKPDELTEYTRIFNCIARNLYVLSFEEIKYNETTQNWKVLIRYGERYAMMPGELEARTQLVDGQLQVP